MQTVEYYIKYKPDNANEYYLSEFDFENTSDVRWGCSFKHAFSFLTLRAALALKMYIEETCGNYDKLTVVEVTTIIEEVKGQE